VRRAVLGLAGLAASTTLLVVVKGAADATPTTVSASAVPPANGLAPASGSPAPPAPSGGPAATAAPDGTPAPAATTKKPKPKKTATEPPDEDEPAPPPPPSNRKTFTGTREQNPYGAVQLEITVQGSRMVEIRAIEMPDSESRSDQLSDQVSVQLREEALQEQGYDLDTVSGATETSVSYRDSLRAAIEEWK
jgi:uncharacterized protein with FMN-binding domain